MTGRIEKTVFISYRRTNISWALFVFQSLKLDGYDVFFDYESIASGNFESVILDNIRARAHFIVILTPSALDNCNKPNDWLRREIETAIDENRNIIPFMVDGFDFNSPTVKNALTGKLKTLNTYNGLPVPNAYVFEAMDRLKNRFLNIALTDVPKFTLQPEAQKITQMQIAAADNAPLVEELKNTPIEVLNLSEGIKITLHHVGIKTLRDLLSLLGKSEKDSILSILSFGEKSLDELRQIVKKNSYFKDA